MKQLLIIDKNTQLSKVVKLNLMNTYNFNVIEKGDVAAAMSLLEILPDISLIIIRDENTKTNRVNDLFAYLETNKRDLPLIILGNGRYTYKKAVSLDSESAWGPIVDMTGKILGLDVVVEHSQSASDYSAVPANYFLGLDETIFGCDIFLRVRKTEDFQYIKRVKAGDAFDNSEIEKYIQSGLKDFFIPKEQFSDLVNFFTERFSSKISKATSHKDLLEAGSSGYDLTAERIASIGIDQKTIDLATMSVKTMHASLSAKNALSDFLNLMMQNKLSYSYAHSFLISLLMIKIIKQFEWYSPSVKEKITFISFFHDISLHNDKLFQIDSQEELNRRVELTNEQKNLVLQHASKSAAIVEQFSGIPMGIASLIKEHHGVKSGNGFTTSWSHMVSPLAIVFIVVEYFTNAFLKIEGTPSQQELEDILAKMSIVFESGTYAQTVEALHHLVIKKI